MGSPTWRRRTRPYLRARSVIYQYFSQPWSLIVAGRRHFYLSFSPDQKWWCTANHAFWLVANPFSFSTLYGDLKTSWFITCTCLFIWYSLS